MAEPAAGRHSLRGPGAGSRPLAALGLGVLLGGCAMALGPRQPVAGAEFPLEAIARLGAGDSRQEVRRAVGEPWRRELGGGRESWEYYVRVQRRSCRRLLFGQLPLGRRPSDTHRARLVFGPAGLERAILWLRDVDGRRRVELLGDVAAKAGRG